MERTANPEPPRPPAGRSTPGGPAAVGIGPGGRRPGGRDVDRRIATLSICAAAGFLALALAAVLVPLASGGPAAPWLPLHLALAGGATTAIAGVMPFFVGALAGAPPADPRLRVGAVALVALGALGVAARGVVPGVGWLPVAGGAAYLGGIAVAALVTRRAARRGMLARRPVVMAAYGLALGNVAVGATIGLLAVLGWVPVLAGWGTLRIAHAWSNLLGFVSLVVIGTLLHFLPTVLAGRIVPRRSAMVAVAGIGLGAPAVALGAVGVVAGSVVALPGDLLARGGAVLTLAGVAGLVAETAAVVRARGRWTTDPGWHLVSGGALVAGVAWFAAGATLAAVPVLVQGPVAAAWTTSLVVPALTLGWVIQVLVGSWTHLLPAIGGGGPAGHAARRAVLGRFAAPRLVALNAGTALVAIGWPAGVGPLAAAGLALVGLGLGTSIALVVAAMRTGEAAPPGAGAPRAAG